uniref:carbonic anhydrase n=1 Tax=Chlorella sp. ArM0029B TaxID=1415603 RepID=A0A345AXB7_9CHLO|nr:carbonic anhydrase CAH200 [Chlorella sp. ArM0029B]
MKTALVLLALCLAGASACSHVYTHQRGRQLSEGSACSYNHAQAGLDWPAQDKECGWSCSGKSQSPINIPAKGKGTRNLPASLKAKLNFGTATNVRVLNIGHAVQVEFDSPKNNKASVVYFGDSIYTMYNSSSLNSRKAKRVNIEPLQFHFHATSEHLLSGRSTMLELHLVTKMVATPGVPMPKECRTADSMCLAVFGAMYNIRSDPTAKRGDPVMQRIIDALPKCEEAGKDCKRNVAGWKLPLKDLFPANNDYFAYTGSLTTPPCSEGVMWHVFPQIRAELSEAQAIALQTALSTAVMNGEQEKNRLNNRVTLPWNDRTVFYSA